MKKLLFVAAVAAFTMTSCKKTYTCTCTVDGVETVGESDKLNKSERDEFKEACEASDAILKAFDAADGCEFK